MFRLRTEGRLIRAKNAREAERKIMIVFRHELTDKLINFKEDDYPAYDKENNDGKETKEDDLKDG